MAKKKKIKKGKKLKIVKSKGLGFDYPDISSELSLISEKIPELVMMEDTLPTIFVPTIFTSFNRAIQTGGAPTGCLWLVYGPWGEGKTAFVIGLIMSFLRMGYPAAYIDAEHAADTQVWFKALGGAGLLKNCYYNRPKSYEQTVETVFKAIKNFTKAKEDGKIRKDSCFIIVLDSINKLVPENELAEMLKIGKAYPIRALFNSMFTDKLTPAVGGEANIAFVMIAQEREKLDAGKFERGTKVKGGQAIKFDSSVMVRISKGKAIKVGPAKGEKITIANTHRIVVEKNKVGICYGKGAFYTATGQGAISLGFDLAREVVEESIKRGVLKKQGKEFILPERYRIEAKGKENIINELSGNRKAYRKLAARLDEESAED